MGIGFTYSKVSYLPPKSNAAMPYFYGSKANSGSDLFYYGPGAKISISLKIDLNILTADDICRDILIIGNPKYRYLLCILGAVWKVGKK